MFIAEHRKLRRPGTSEAPGEDELTSVYLAGPDESIEAEICPEIGCTCFSLRLGGQEVLHFPFNLNHYRASKDLAGIPLLYPWANRLEGNSFSFRGKEYPLEGPDIYRDGNGLPIHGLILKSPSWSLKDLNASGTFARALFEFGAEDAMLRNLFPFLQGIALTFELTDAGLRILLEVENRDRSAFPLAPGFHPYFSYAGFEREDVILEIPARECLELDSHYLPTGERTATADRWPEHTKMPLASHRFDTIFTALPGEDPVFRMHRPDLSVGLHFGKDYPVGIVYAPTDQPFVCLEPMTAPTNAFHLAGRGLWDLQVLEPGQKSSFEFWIELIKRPD